MLEIVYTDNKFNYQINKTFKMKYFTLIAVLILSVAVFGLGQDLWGATHNVISVSSPPAGYQWQVGLPTAINWANGNPSDANTVSISFCYPSWPIYADNCYIINDATGKLNKVPSPGSLSNYKLTISPAFVTNWVLPYFTIPPAARPYGIIRAFKGYQTTVRVCPTDPNTGVWNGGNCSYSGSFSVLDPNNPRGVNMPRVDTDVSGDSVWSVGSLRNISWVANNFPPDSSVASPSDPRVGVFFCNPNSSCGYCKPAGSAYTLLPWNQASVDLTLGSALISRFIDPYINLSCHSRPDDFSRVFDGYKTIVKVCPTMTDGSLMPGAICYGQQMTIGNSAASLGSISIDGLAEGGVWNAGVSKTVRFSTEGIPSDKYLKIGLWRDGQYPGWDELTPPSAVRVSAWTGSLNKQVAASAQYRHYSLTADYRIKVEAHNTSSLNSPYLGLVGTSYPFKIKDDAPPAPDEPARPRANITLAAPTVQLNYGANFQVSWQATNAINCDGSMVPTNAEYGAGSGTVVGGFPFNNLSASGSVTTKVLMNEYDTYQVQVCCDGATTEYDRGCGTALVYFNQPLPSGPVLTMVGTTQDNFKGSVLTIPQNETFTISWNLINGGGLVCKRNSVAGVTGWPGGATITASGSNTVHFDAPGTKNFIISCYLNGYKQFEKTVTVTANSASAPTVKNVRIEGFDGAGGYSEAEQARVFKWRVGKYKYIYWDTVNFGSYNGATYNTVSLSMCLPEDLTHCVFMGTAANPTKKIVSALPTNNKSYQPFGLSVIRKWLFPYESLTLSQKLATSTIVGVFSAVKENSITIGYKTKIKVCPTNSYGNTPSGVICAYSSYFSLVDPNHSLSPTFNLPAGQGCKTGSCVCYNGQAKICGSPMGSPTYNCLNVIKPCNQSLSFVQKMVAGVGALGGKFIGLFK